MHKWLYFGIHNDPHYRVWLPGMVPLGAEADNALPLAMREACIPPSGVPSFEVRITEIADGRTAYAFLESWCTQLNPNPVASLFVTSKKYDTAADALAAAQLAFPQVWSRFGKLSIGETCKYAPQSSAASLNSMPPAVPESAPASPSAKSSA